MSTPPLAACRSPRGGSQLLSGICVPNRVGVPAAGTSTPVNHSPKSLPCSASHSLVPSRQGGRLTFCCILIIGQRGDLATNDVNLVKTSYFCRKKKRKERKTTRGQKVKTVIYLFFIFLETNFLLLTAMCCINYLGACYNHQNGSSPL